MFVLKQPTMFDLSKGPNQSMRRLGKHMSAGAAKGSLYSSTATG